MLLGAIEPVAMCRKLRWVSCTAFAASCFLPALLIICSLVSRVYNREYRSFVAVSSFLSPWLPGLATYMSLSIRWKGNRRGSKVFLKLTLQGWRESIIPRQVNQAFIKGMASFLLFCPEMLMVLVSGLATLQCLRSSILLKTPLNITPLGSIFFWNSGNHPFCFSAVRL